MLSKGPNDKLGIANVIARLFEGMAGFAMIGQLAIKIVLKYRRRNIPVTLVGLNAASATLLDKLAIHDKSGAAEQAGGH